MEVVFGSILFDTKIEIAKDFFESINQQDRNDFDILLINDNFNEKELNTLLKQYSKLHIEIVNTNGKLTRYDNRKLLIHEAKKRGYKLLVRGDFDDTFSSNRIRSYIEQYDENYGFFYNDILVNNESMFNDLPKITDDFKIIAQQNYLGEGACAINLDKLDYDFIESLSKGKTIVFDWYLFTRLLLKGLKGKLINNTYTYYRLYENNNVGIASLNEETINREIEVKKLHYFLLQEEDNYYKNLLDKYNNSDNIIINHYDKYNWWQFSKVEE